MEKAVREYRERERLEQPSKGLNFEEREKGDAETETVNLD
jgi:hypothetical protein